MTNPYSILGKGAYRSWFYEVSLYAEDGTENEMFERVTGSYLEVEDLMPDTGYQVRVRALSSTGTGPWSEVFIGRTLTLGKYSYRVYKVNHKVKIEPLIHVCT